MGLQCVDVAGSMKRKERYIARLDEVTIIREGEYVFIEYKEEGIPRTGLQIGPEIVGMSDGARLLNCITNAYGLRPRERPNTSTWLSKYPWALRKSSTSRDVINGFPEAVCCAA